MLVWAAVLVSWKTNIKVKWRPNKAIFHRKFNLIRTKPAAAQSYSLHWFSAKFIFFRLFVRRFLFLVSPGRHVHDGSHRVCMSAVTRHNDTTREKTPIDHEPQWFLRTRAAANQQLTSFFDVTCSSDWFTWADQPVHSENVRTGCRSTANKVDAEIEVGIGSNPK